MKGYLSLLLMGVLLWSTFVFSDDKPHSTASRQGITPSSACAYFPSTVQSWEGNRNNFFLSSLGGSLTSFIDNAKNNQIGFDNLVINEFSNHLYTPENQKRSSRCNDRNTTCLLDGEFARPYTQSFIVPSGVDRQFNYISEGKDKVFKSSTYFHSTYGAPYYGLFINKNTRVTFTSGEYWFDGINVMSGAEIHIDGDVVFHIKDELWVGGKVLQKENSSLMMFSYRKGGCPKPKYLPDYIPDIYWAPSDDYQRINLDKGAVIEGHIYSQGPVQLSNNAKVVGSITACQLKMSNDAQIIGKTLASCDKPKYHLAITPTSGKGLACDGIAIDFSLVDSDGNVVEGKGQQLQVISTPVAVEGRNSACWSEDGNMTTPECNHADDSRFDTVFPSSGPAVVTRYLHSKFLNSYNVSASVSSDNLTTTEGPYEFIAKAISMVPSEGVDGSDHQHVAGRPFPFRLMIRGQENEHDNALNCRVIKENRNINVRFSNEVLPISSSENLSFYQRGLGWTEANKSVLVPFVNGVAGGNEHEADGSLQARLNDAGKVTLHARTSIQGHEFTDSQQFYFRPFTAALCDRSSAFPAYTDEVGLNRGFLASGVDFNANVKAVNWIKALDSGRYGDGIPDRHAPSLVCNNIATPSYISHGEGVATLSLSSQLDYPLLGDIGVITVDDEFIADFSKEVTRENQNSSTKVNWNEVGTLRFGVFQNHYFNRAGFNIPSTDSKVGRFYPAYFSITKTEWEYPQNQGSSKDGFVYMEQFFNNVDFQVTAYSALDSEVTNYGLFNNELKSRFSLSGDYASRVNITDEDLDERHWSHQAVWQVTDLEHAVMWSKKEDPLSSENRTTLPDGPFNLPGQIRSETTHLTLQISGTDPVTFIKGQHVLDAELLSQPNVRYGRMVLKDVGATFGHPVSVPLRVEYWNGQRFVVSKEDDAARFNGSSYCKQVIWPESNQISAAQLMGTGGVRFGFNSIDLMAEPDNGQLREQIRFWLRLSESSPQLTEDGLHCELAPSDLYRQPWLQFNWRGKGDEDPSALVTFGVYRGNDRVIFRGESNIIGTSN